MGNRTSINDIFHAHMKHTFFPSLPFSLNRTYAWLCLGVDRKWSRGVFYESLSPASRMDSLATWGRGLERGRGWVFSAAPRFLWVPSVLGVLPLRLYLRVEKFFPPNHMVASWWDNCSGLSSAVHFSKGKNVTNCESRPSLFESDAEIFVILHSTRNLELLTF